MGLSGATIRERRKEDHMTQKELAELLQISPTYLAEIETGRRKASDKLLERIKFFLDLYRPDTGLEILLDYCRIRFSSTDFRGLLPKRIRLTRSLSSSYLDASDAYSIICSSDKRTDS